MVARIKRGGSLSRTLNYNEQKLQRKEAECIHAVNYPKDLKDLTFYNKLRRLEHQAALNERVKTNSVHISLNFADADKLNQEQLRAISDSYMRQIGFGNQPYLVYEHRDAGHQHIHIVTTNIRFDGSKIDMNNIGRNQSETARKSIEKLYGLVEAEGQRNRLHEELAPVSAQKVQYGERQTKQAIANVLNHLVKNYNFTSLGELNAVLKLYNVTADPGDKDSRLRQYNGLLYRALDEQGNKIGTPIKASAFYNKPTLANLEKQYAKNKTVREPLKKRMKIKIDWALRGGNTSLAELKRDMKKESIEMVVRRNDQGMAYGVTFVDLKNRCSINGSELGKEYSAKGLQERCTSTQGQFQQIPQVQEAKPKLKQEPLMKDHQATELLLPSPGGSNIHQESLWEQLMNPEIQQEFLPYELRHDPRKKKKNRLKH